MAQRTYTITPDAATPLPLTPPATVKSKVKQFVLETNWAVPNTDAIRLVHSIPGVPVGITEETSQTIDIGGSMVFPVIQDGGDHDLYDMTAYYVISASGNQRVKVTITTEGDN